MSYRQKSQWATIAAFVALVSVTFGRNIKPGSEPKHCGSDSMELYTNPTTGEERCVCKSLSLDEGRPMIFIPGSAGKRDECFPLHTQGPCSKGYWLSWNEDWSSITCRKNHCLHKFNTSPNSTDGGHPEPVVPWNGDCYDVGENCTINTTDDGEVRYGESGSGNTTCRLKRAAPSSWFGQTSSGGECPPNTLRVGGSCIQYTPDLTTSYDY